MEVDGGGWRNRNNEKGPRKSRGGKMSEEVAVVVAETSTTDR
jgi:hypothetical protein